MSDSLLDAPLVAGLSKQVNSLIAENERLQAENESLKDECARYMEQAEDERYKLESAVEEFRDLDDELLHLRFKIDEIVEGLK